MPLDTNNLARVQCRLSYRGCHVSLGLADRTMKRNDTAVKVDAETVRKAKILAAFREQTLAELLSEVLEPIIDKLLAEEIAKQAKPKR